MGAGLDPRKDMRNECRHQNTPSLWKNNKNIKYLKKVKQSAVRMEALKEAA